MAEEQAVLAPASVTQRKFLQNQSKLCIYGGGAGSGKALRHGEKVLTPAGFVNIEDMKIGDAVITPNNTTEYVTGVYPQGEVDIFKVTFQDGVSVETCENHLWKYHLSGKGDINSAIGTTQKLQEILEKSKGKTKGRPIIPLTSPVDLPDMDGRVMKPYTLGALLGDGCLVDCQCSAFITTTDHEILDNIEADGYAYKASTNNAYRISGAVTEIKELGLWGATSSSKFIPEQYIYAPIEDRFSLIQGLMDTDGYADSDGSCEFYSVSEKLADGVEFILRSLGYTVTRNLKQGKYKKQDGEVVICQMCHVLYIRGRNLNNLFRLKRKVERCKYKKVGNRIASIEKSGKDFATCISITGEDKLFLTTNFIVTHNSHLALMLALGYIHDPNFRAVYIRQTSPQLTQAGGLWQEAQAMYRQFGAKFKQKPQMTAVFPSGAEVQFKVSGGPADVTNFDGSQWSLVVFDEAQWHSIEEISYLESRIRSRAEGPHRMVCTCNPSKDSPLLNFVRWYIDDITGIPIPERSGVERYYARWGGDFVFGDSIRELREKFSEDIKPQTYTFISATIYDNPILIKKNPDYLYRLENLKRVERERLLLGSWFAAVEGEGYFKRDWIPIVDSVPSDIVARVRSWDLAYSEKTEAYPDPDYTAGVRLSRDRMGIYYIEDVAKCRRLTDGVIRFIIETAEEDPEDTQVTIPKENSAGKASYLFFTRTLAECGVAVRPVVVSTKSGKVQRFLPFASICEAGMVKMVRGDWNEEFLMELESFTGKQRQHDDKHTCRQ